MSGLPSWPTTWCCTPASNRDSAHPALWQHGNGDQRNPARRPVHVGRVRPRAMLCQREMPACDIPTNSALRSRVLEKTCLYGRALSMVAGHLARLGGRPLSDGVVAYSAAAADVVGRTSLSRGTPHHRTWPERLLHHRSSRLGIAAAASAARRSGNLDWPSQLQAAAWGTRACGTRCREPVADGYRGGADRSWARSNDVHPLRRGDLVRFPCELAAFQRDAR